MWLKIAISKYCAKIKKGSRTIYDILVGNKDLTPPPRKWVNIIGNISENEWNSYNTMTKNIKEVKLQEFQFKGNNHILVTKSFLLKIKKVDNDRCSFCNQESETIIHVLFLCNKVKEFWVALQNWLRIQANIELELIAKNILFLKPSKKGLLNHILLLAKYFIYKTKFYANRIILENFCIYLKRKYKMKNIVQRFTIDKNNFKLNGPLYINY